MWVRASAALLATKRSAGVALRGHSWNPVMKYTAERIHPGFEAGRRNHQKSKKEYH